MNPSNDTTNALDTLITALQNPALYHPPAQAFRVIETHISYVLLTGNYAYKIKKPLNLGFLDFSTLDKRRGYCEKELRLNRRLAPNLYIGVVVITGTPSQPCWGGAGPVLEYAVKMRQFPQQSLLDEILSHGTIHPRHLIQLARRLATFHHTITPAPADTHYGEPANIRQPTLQNFSQIRPLLNDEASRLQLEALRAWSEREFLHLESFFQQRKTGGFIREGHGDLHSGNMVLLDDEIIVFDCIEFNDNLRWIDIINDIAFLVMDLIHHQQPDGAALMLNAWLEECGDYSGIAGLRFYLVYRALIRAKITAIRAIQPNLTAREIACQWRDYHAHIALAERFTRYPPLFLAITHGLAGSGKSTLSQPLAAALGAIRIRSDVERKRLFGLPAAACSESALNAGLYSAEIGQQTYRRLITLGREVLTAGYPAILDATFLQRNQRGMARQLAEAINIPFIIIDFQVDIDTLRTRVRQRTATGGDASEADLLVLEHQIAYQETLAVKEQHHVITIDTKITDVTDVVAAVRTFFDKYAAPA